MEHIIRTAPQLLAYAQQKMRDANLLKNPYFETLRNGHMSREQFCHTQEIYYYTVDFLPKPMANLVARVPSGHDRIYILNGIIAEYGDLESENTSPAIFKAFLKKLGSDLKYVDHSKILPACSHTFHHVLLASSHFDDLEFALGLMGCLNYAFSDISAWIGQTLIERNWVEEKDLIYYRTQDSQPDLQTAETLLSIIEPKWHAKETQELIAQSFDFAIYNLDNYYRELVEI